MIPCIAGPGSRLYVQAESGDLSDGAEVVVTGPSVSQPNYEWLGGNGGYIASGVNGNEALEARAGWSKLFDDISEWTFSNAHTLNRSLSLLADNGYPTGPASGTGRKTLFFDYGVNGVSQTYTSCNYYFDSGVATECQFKLERLMPSEDTDDATDPSWYHAQWLTGMAFMREWGDGTTHFLPDDSVPFNEWVRVETWFTAGTPDTADGFWRRRVTRLSDGSIVHNTSFSGITWRTASSPVFRYACMQNYMDNEIPENTRLRVYMDDIYKSYVESGTGAWVRAELVNNAVYADATEFAICEVTGISGTDWTVKLNGAGTGKYLALFNASDTPTMVEL